MTVKEFMEKTYSEDEHKNRPYVYCKDGYGISIQGGNSHNMCAPRFHCHVYLILELGYPTIDDPMLHDFAYDMKAPTKTFYPFIPMWIVEKLIADHGGIDTTRTFKERTDDSRRAQT